MKKLVPMPLLVVALTGGILRNSCSAFLSPLGLPSQRPPVLPGVLFPEPYKRFNHPSSTAIFATKMLEQALRDLVGSKLVYDYAELRLLSLTGYTETDFEELDTPPITARGLLLAFLKEWEWAVSLHHGNPLAEGDYRNTASILKACESVRPIFDKQATAAQKGTLDDHMTRLKKRIADEQTETIPPNDDSENTIGAHEGLTALLESFFGNMFIPGVFERLLKDESETQLVTFSDRAPQKECVWAITVNERTKVLTVVFRGSVNVRDWMTNIQLIQDEVDNPALDDSYEEEKIGIHFGFYDNLFDNKKRKEDKKVFNEIMNEIDKRFSRGWKLCVTGHSLGGALATVFGFFAAASGRFNQESPVEVYSFASPIVGDDRFRHAFRHLEKTGKLMHARFCHEDDLVPYLPKAALRLKTLNKDIVNTEEWVQSFLEAFDAREMLRVQVYEHVGLAIKLKLDDTPASVEYQQHGGAEETLEEVGKAVANVVEKGFAFFEEVVNSRDRTLPFKQMAESVIHKAKTGIEFLKYHDLGEYYIQIMAEQQSLEDPSAELNGTLVEFYCDRGIVHTAEGD